MSAIVERFEDMSPTGTLRLIWQEDGDIIVVVTRGEDDDFAQASVEFCTPMSGGGNSEHTHAALRYLMAAMAKDELNRKQFRDGGNGRRETLSDDTFTLQRIVDNHNAADEMRKLAEIVRTAR